MLLAIQPIMITLTTLIFTNIGDDLLFCYFIEMVAGKQLLQKYQTENNWWIQTTTVTIVNNGKESRSHFRYPLLTTLVWVTISPCVHPEGTLVTVPPAVVAPPSGPVHVTHSTLDAAVHR